MTDRIHVCFCFDERYFQHALVSIASCIDRCRPETSLVVWVFSDNLHPAQVRILTERISGRNARLEVKLIHDLTALGGVPVNGHVSLATYFRILLPDLLPPEVDRVIYLDCDIVAVGDISGIGRIDLGGRYVAAVENPNFDRYASLGMQLEWGYFNAGVLLVNLALWRRDSITRRALEFATKNRDRLLSWDQDALNACVAGRWLRLDPKWNVQTSFLYSRSTYEDGATPGYSSALREPLILHYSSSSKPWKPDDDHPMRHQYFEVLDRTVFAGWRPKHTPRTLLKAAIKVLLPLALRGKFRLRFSRKPSS